MAQLSLQRSKATAREQALSAEVDALQAELETLQNGQPIREVRSRPVPPPVAHNLQAREGFWFNAGLGLGSLGCGGCDGTISGGSGGLSVGTTINDRLLLGGGSTGFYRSDGGAALSVGMLDARVRFYPVRTSGFFLTGGLGLGTVTAAAVGFGRTSESGVAMILGLGWDIRVRPNLSLTPFWNGFGVATSNANVSAGQLGLGITVH
jgi:hypothetical protein